MMIILKKRKDVILVYGRFLIAKSRIAPTIAIVMMMAAMPGSRYGSDVVTIWVC
jgi:hypothetical protein